MVGLDLAKKVDGMRTSLPEIRQTAPVAGLKPQKRSPETRPPPAKPIRQPSRRSRMR